jgi:hypothetical protein
MTQNVSEGRKLLEQHQELLEARAEQDSSYRVLLVATWGLLHILEGDLEGGAKLYRRAARIGMRAGDRQGAQAAIQKMHLELARTFVARKEIDAAQKEVTAGLLVRGGREPFKRDLANIQKLLKA